MTQRPQTVHSESDARALAARILSPRTRPLVVISSDPSTGDYPMDPEEVLAEVGDLADLALITTGDLTRAVEAVLPPRAQVYGGAARSYPADFHADPDWARSPLRFPSESATRTLIGDVLAQANAAGLFAQAPSRSVEAQGIVKGFTPDGSRALVDIDGGRLATISRELTYPPFPLEWTLTKGQRVTGILDPEVRRLFVELPAPVEAELAAAFPHLSVTFALVQKVTERRAQLLLHPKAPAIVLRLGDVSPNPRDTVDLLLAEGDVVAARVVHLAEGLHLRLIDVDDDEPVMDALAVTAGGPPWLREGRPLVAVEHAVESEVETVPVPSASSPEQLAPDPAATAATAASAATVAPEPPATASRPVPGPGRRPALSRAQAMAAESPTGAAGAATDAPSTAHPPGTALKDALLRLEAAHARIRLLEADLAAAGASDSGLQQLRERAKGAEARMRETLADYGTLSRRVGDLEEANRQSTRKLREARRAPASPAPVADPRARRARWATDDDWVRHELYLAWVDRVEPNERIRWPLGEVVIGPRFAASLQQLDDGQFDKAMRAAVDAATGRIRDIPSRHLHPLRTGDGADDPDTVRADGARCWRAYIEHSTASARRLHYWVLPGGGIELSRIVLHDDMEP